MITAAVRVLLVVSFGLVGSSSLAWAAFTASTTVDGSFGAATYFSPVLRSVPDVLGAPRGGSALTANDPTFEASLPPTSRTHQWRRCDTSGGACTDISGATSATYTVASADVGSTLRVRVTAVRGDAPATVSQSDPTVTAQTGGLSSVPTNTSPPTLSGTTAVGSVLTVSDGSWSGASGGFDHVWYRCDARGTACVAVGTNSSTYLLTSADSGSRMRARVIAKVLLSSTTNAATTPDTSFVN